MSRFYLTPEADADLDGIDEYYADKSPAAGRRLIREITRGCQLRAGQTNMGTPRDDLGTGVRSFPAQPYVVFFRPVDGGIEVIRIIHGSRDIGPDMFSG